MNTEQIKARIADLHEEIANLRAQADERQKLADEYQAELDLRWLIEHGLIAPQDKQQQETEKR